MPEELQIARATLRPVDIDSEGGVTELDAPKPVEVQFNPETLKLKYAVEKQGGDKPSQTGLQFVGKGATTVSLDLLFDTTREGEEKDVRKLTEKVLYYIQPQKVKGKKDEYVVPSVRFSWGSFLFDGVMDSMDETLEFFDADGHPLRASVSISITQNKVDPDINDVESPVPPWSQPGSAEAGATGEGDDEPGEGSSSPEAAPPGTDPRDQGQSLQKLAAAKGRLDDWKSIAAANGIENPRQIRNPAALDFDASIDASFDAGVSASAQGNVRGTIEAGNVRAERSLEFDL